MLSVCGITLYSYTVYILSTKMSHAGKFARLFQISYCGHGYYVASSTLLW